MSRRVLDLESEVMRGLGSIPTGVTFFTGFFCFHIVNPLLSILALLPFLCISKKNSIDLVKFTEFNQFTEFNESSLFGKTPLLFSFFRQEKPIQNAKNSQN